MNVNKIDQPSVYEVNRFTWWRAGFWLRVAKLLDGATRWATRQAERDMRRLQRQIWHSR